MFLLPRPKTTSYPRIIKQVGSADMQPFTKHVTGTYIVLLTLSLLHHFFEKKMTLKYMPKKY
jgi:hypothetical protein